MDTTVITNANFFNLLNSIIIGIVPALTGYKKNGPLKIHKALNENIILTKKLEKRP
jgi:hypothetical protein